MALALAPAIGPLLGGYLTQNFSWPANFICLTMMGLALFAYVFLALPETAIISSPDNNILQLTEKPNSQSNYTFFTLIKKMLLDKHIMASSILVGGFNGILFGYYSESPYIFIELFGIDPVHYGMLGIFMAAAVCLGSFISHRINYRVNTHTLITFSCYVNLMIMVFFSILVGLKVINDKSTFSIILIMICMMLFYISFGIGIPNILSKALMCYQDNVGAASSIFGLLYYCAVSIFVFGIGSFLPNSLFIMPLYFLIISLLMVICSKYLTIDTKLLPKLMWL